ncbi:hypothetical protein BABINDRAFT_161379 [Babjeviella inositovora NRRL Y-12698]|uniref:Uncharacterized protein n=1 Tax=Babjeviella inositovora NRRL Y-12698 TaxID=984486 RepID=A0A1E3QRZ8_9ASCO|nr:uncharacterized protein BABINDRAFT_161379 [Babjeviella inositovora NRRL Y-12698]ODQ80440.1 hypothetical protein BABINDRAFT_161379 [Babjeviella inositovora NRRL Y-12698]
MNQESVAIHARTQPTNFLSRKNSIFERSVQDLNTCMQLCSPVNSNGMNSSPPGRSSSVTAFGLSLPLSPPYHKLIRSRTSNTITSVSPPEHNLVRRNLSLYIPSHHNLEDFVAPNLDSAVEFCYCGGDSPPADTELQLSRLLSANTAPRSKQDASQSPTNNEEFFPPANNNYSSVMRSRSRSIVCNSLMRCMSNTNVPQASNGGDENSATSPKAPEKRSLTRNPSTQNAGRNAQPSSVFRLYSWNTNGRAVESAPSSQNSSFERVDCSPGSGIHLDFHSYAEILDDEAHQE